MNNSIRVCKHLIHSTYNIYYYRTYKVFSFSKLFSPKITLRFIDDNILERKIYMNL